MCLLYISYKHNLILRCYSLLIHDGFWNWVCVLDEGDIFQELNIKGTICAYDIAIKQIKLCAMFSTSIPVKTNWAEA